MSFNIHYIKSSNKLYGKIILLLSFLIYTLSGCYKEIELNPFNEHPYLKLNEISCGIDFDRGLILVPIRKELMAKFNPVINTNLDSLRIGGRAFRPGDRISFHGNLLTDSIYITFIDTRGFFFQGYLQFTTLPVIQIFSNITVPDGYKVTCEVFLSDYQSNINGLNKKFHAGIEIRGRTAAVRPKKSYNIELWVDSIRSSTHKESLLNMRKDDDWILDAMYIDKARMRNKISMELWRDICESDSSGAIPGSKPYTEGKFVELFINQDYSGLYCLTERFDRKQLNLKRSDTTFKGLLYKTEVWTNTTTFTELADTAKSRYWDGWEQKYPDPEYHLLWWPVYNFTDFVMHSTDNEFKDKITQYVNMNNFIDYFLFVNVSQAFDNMGTNMYYARYDADSPFTIYPWDLEATWGRNWDSTLITDQYFLSNLVYKRMFHNDVNDCLKTLKDRWFDLRKEVITADGLKARFRLNENLIDESGAVERERRRWPEMKLNQENEIQYINSWIDNRLTYLDQIYLSINKKDW